MDKINGIDTKYWKLFKFNKFIDLYFKFNKRNKNKKINTKFLFIGMKKFKKTLKTENKILK